MWSTILLFTSFSKTLLITERKLTGQQFLVVDLSPTFLNTGTTDETLQQCGKKDSFRHILKRLASMYESSGSQFQFLRTNTGIQSGPDAFDESRFVMTFLTILKVMEILCNFRLVLEVNIGQEIAESSRLELWEKFLANNFALWNAEGDTSGPLNRGDKADLPFLKTLSNSPKVPRAKFLGIESCFVLVAYASLTASRTILQRLLACLNFTFDSEDLFCCYKWRNDFYSAENYGDERSLTWYLWWVIYTSISTWTHSQSSLAVVQALNLKISFDRTSLKWWRRPCQSAQE